VPVYELPDPLVFGDGRRVAQPEQWPARRAELLELFERQVYGRAPAWGGPISARSLAEHEVLDGRATRRQIRLSLVDGEGAELDLLLYLPRGSEGPVPIFLALNFRGNHTIESDPGIVVSRGWVQPRDDGPRDVAQERGGRARRWPVELLVDRGYGLATAHYTEIDPDFDDGFLNGVHPRFRAAGQSAPASDEWGSIAAWAWGLSRIQDYLEGVDEVDAERVVVLGHSRLGKTALWAGAQDERFAAVISNNSGCGGAALSRRRFGETVEAINTRFPHWFADNFTRYDGREDELPIDQHQLLSLIAPRPLYVASASEDLWADPRGEFLALAAADPVYRLLAGEGLELDAFPEPGGGAIGRLSYHLREGRHDLVEWDWLRYLDFADRVLGSGR
jgi:hypothetical protein